MRNAHDRFCFPAEGGYPLSINRGVRSVPSAVEVAFPHQILGLWRGRLRVVRQRGSRLGFISLLSIVVCILGSTCVSGSSRRLRWKIDEDLRDVFETFELLAPSPELKSSSRSVDARTESGKAVFNEASGRCQAEGRWPPRSFCRFTPQLPGWSDAPSLESTALSAISVAVFPNLYLIISTTRAEARMQ